MELEKIEHKVDDRQVFEFHEYIVGLVRGINRDFIDLARCLTIAHENKIYEYLGYETFESYIAIPEISIRRSSAYKLMKLYKTYVRELKVSPARLLEIEWTKLYTTLPVVNEDNAEELLAMAESLSRSDLRAEIKLLKDPDYEEDEQFYKTCPHCEGTGKIPIDNN